MPISSIFVPVVIAALSVKFAGNVAPQAKVEFRVERAIVEVPISHEDPEGPKYRLNAVRVFHPDAELSRSGTPSVFLAGGPGDSGVRVVEGLVQHGGLRLFDLLGGDIIGIDERGVNGSEPDLGGPVRYNIPPGPAGDPEAVLLAVLHAQAERARQLRSRGVDLQSIHPVASAKDIGLVLHSMGVDSINLWGRSYGSHLAIAVDRFNPGLVNHMILVGPEGPNQTLKLPTNVDAVVERLGEAVMQSPELGDAIPDLRNLILRVIAKLQTKPVVIDLHVPSRPDPVEVGISAWDVKMLIWSAMADQRNIADLPTILLEMESGEFKRAAQLVGAARASMSLSTPMNRIMDLSCGSTPGRIARVQKQTPESLLGGVINFGIIESDKIWDVHDSGDAYRLGEQSQTPALVIVGDLDPRTPLENAQDLRRLLPQGSIITIRNATHNFPLFDSDRLRDIFVDFLADQPVTDQTVDLPAIRFVPIGKP